MEMKPNTVRSKCSPSISFYQGFCITTYDTIEVIQDTVHTRVTVLLLLPHCFSSISKCIKRISLAPAEWLTCGAHAPNFRAFQLHHILLALSNIYTLFSTHSLICVWNCVSQKMQQKPIHSASQIEANFSKCIQDSGRQHAQFAHNLYFLLFSYNWPLGF